MSKTQRTLVDFNATDGAESGSERAESSEAKRPDWTPAESGSFSGADGLECECGRALTSWPDTSAADARRAVRHYGDEDAGTVPACPGCVDWRDNDDCRVESIPHAIHHMSHESSAEAHNPRALVVEHSKRQEVTRR